jgi:hypothetical protein
MTKNLCSQKQWWIAFGAALWFALSTTAASSGETTGSVGTTGPDRATCAGPGALSESVQVEVRRMGLNVNGRKVLAAAQIRTNADGDPCGNRSQRVVAYSSSTGDHIQKGHSVPAAAPGKAASRGSVHALRSHGWAAHFGRGRFAATFAKQLAGDPDDDQASDNPHDDDDAYEDIDVYYNTDVPTIGWVPAPVPFLAAPEFATETWVAPAFTPFSMLQRLRC